MEQDSPIHLVLLQCLQLTKKKLTEKIKNNCTSALKNPENTHVGWGTNTPNSTILGYLNWR